MSANSKTIYAAHAALMGVNLFYGLNYVIAKEATPVFLSPFSLVGFRVLGACLVFNLLFFIFSSEKVARQDFPRIIFCAFAGVAANVGLFIYGLSLTSPINASLIMITVPILVLLFSAFFLGEKLTRPKIMGVILGALGAFLLVYRTSQSGGGGSNIWGDLMIFLNACSYSMYIVQVKPLMKKYKPITVLRWVFSLGLLFLSPIILYNWSEQIFTDIPFNIWMAVGYVVIFATIFTYLLNIFAIKHVQPSLVSIYIYTQPIIASAIAVASGKYALQWEHFVASAFIFVGVWLISRRPTKKSSAQPQI